jgi:hypothetical protein
MNTGYLKNSSNKFEAGRRADSHASISKEALKDGGLTGPLLGRLRAVWDTAYLFTREIGLKMGISAWH